MTKNPEMIRFYPSEETGFTYTGLDRTLRYKDVQGNDVVVTAPEGHVLRFWYSVDGAHYQTVPQE